MPTPPSQLERPKDGYYHPDQDQVERLSSTATTPPPVAVVTVATTTIIIIIQCPVPLL